ncbi:MAG: hypothetical protein Q6373_017485 [Candidatus Sigynarchaeota archaeon]
MYSAARANTAARPLELDELFEKTVSRQLHPLLISRWHKSLKLSTLDEVILMATYKSG